MAGRKRKVSPAELRTVDMFTGKTPIEAAEEMLREEEPEIRDTSGRAPTEIVEMAEDAAIRWLGMDCFHEGDDIKIAVHPKGHAVVMLIRTTKGTHGPAYHSVDFKLSRQQWAKLKKLVREAS